MSAKKPDISQIDQYLKGKLDTRAMHKLERQAQDDPFLMDALEGYAQSGKDQQANLDQLKARLAKRIAPAKERNIMIWRVLPIAASVLLMLGLGYLFFKPAPVKQQYANVITKEKEQSFTESPSAKKEIIVKQNDVVVHVHKLRQVTSPVLVQEQANIADAGKKTYLDNDNYISTPSPTYKKDTTEYIANNYKNRPNAVVEDVLKKLPGFEVDEKGNVTSQGQQITKAKLNGKTFMGGDVAKAVQNLPADILEKIQIVDDYGDQATKTGIKNGNPTKVLNLVTDTINKQNLIAVNRPAPVLKEVNVTSPLMESKVIGRAAGISTINPNVNSRQVTGTILDDKGMPLIGATVKVDGANNGVTTDMKGNFKIDLPENKDLLAVNYVGYNAKQVKVGDQKDLKIALNENQSNLNEVVVVGYGTQKKPTTCTENPEFKKNFFDDITVVEKYVTEQLTGTQHTIKQRAFKKALRFILKHTNGRVDKAYTDMAAFQADKKLWLNWYEANKCSNLK